MLKRVVLLAALAALMLPAVAQADGVMFGFMGGRISAPRPTNQTNTPLSTTIGSNVHYVTATTGGLPGTPVAPTYGLPPHTLPGTGTPGAWMLNYGTVTYSTGAPISYFGTNNLGDGVLFGAGGFITIVSNSSFESLTGGAIPAGTTLFSGTFTQPATMTQINAPSATCSADPTCLASFNYYYQLVGAVSGNLSPILLQHLGLSPGTTGAAGFVITLNLGFVGPNDAIGNPEGGMLSVVVPEPGTLALFGTGLMGLAGLIRRRMRA